MFSLSFALSFLFVAIVFLWYIYFIIIPAAETMAPYFSGKSVVEGKQLIYFKKPKPNHTLTDAIDGDGDDSDGDDSNDSFVQGRQ